MNDLPIAQPARRAVTASVLIGTAGVALDSRPSRRTTITINNSFITGNFFPPALVLGLLALGRSASFCAAACALAGGELGVITAMLLVTARCPAKA